MYRLVIEIECRDGGLKEGLTGDERTVTHEEIAGRFSCRDQKKSQVEEPRGLKLNISLMRHVMAASPP